jgi:hypothetical protein
MALSDGGYVRAILQYLGADGDDDAIGPVDSTPTLATDKHVRYKMSVTTSELVIPLGPVTAPGWAIFVNRDATNFINLKVATGGAIFAKLLPGECALLRLGSGAQAPYAIADTATCEMEVMIIAT